MEPLRATKVGCRGTEQRWRAGVAWNRLRGHRGVFQGGDAALRIVPSSAHSNPRVGQVGELMPRGVPPSVVLQARWQPRSVVSARVKQ